MDWIFSKLLNVVEEENEQDNDVETLNLNEELEDHSSTGGLKIYKVHAEQFVSRVWELTGRTVQVWRERSSSVDEENIQLILKNVSEDWGKAQLIGMRTCKIVITAKVSHLYLMYTKHTKKFRKKG